MEKGKPQPPRFVVDYRGLNSVTSGDGYPIPSVSNILDSISTGKIFSKLDLASGYWQIQVNPPLQPCVYQKIPQAREILSRHGKLKGLTNSCPYLQLAGKSHGGTYIISHNQKLFDCTNK